MAEVTIRFTLPEDEQELCQSMAGGALLCVLLDVDDFVRRKIKYEDLSDATTDVLQNVRDRIRGGIQSVRLLGDMEV